MKYNAIYHFEQMEDGREVHAIDHDGGGFVVSSREVGVAVQNFLHFATLTDLATLHSHLLREYARRSVEDNTIDLKVRMPEKAMREMRNRGFTDGENAAAWMVDGNTPDPFMFLSKIMTGIEECDPEILDDLPHPRVGGEFADDPTWEDICIEILGEYNDGEDEMFAVYTESFHEGVINQIRKMYRDYGPSRKS